MKIVVIGGGAAGFFSAIASAETHPRAKVILLEKGAHVLTKVRISGGGRCNVTHSCFDPKVLVKNYPRGGRELLGPFHRFQPKDTMAWFESRGVQLKTEEDGRIFPVTDTSLTIINALKDAAKEAQVEVRTNSAIDSVTNTGPSKFLVTMKDGETISCDRLILASGSNPQGYEWAQSFGHTIVPPVPSLFTFSIPDERLRGLSGISVEKARIKIVGADLEQTGPILITHWGLSGPAVLKLSAWGARVLHDSQYQSQIEINWASRNRPDIERQLKEFKLEHPRKTVSSNTMFGLPQRLWERLVKATAFPIDQRWADISNAQMLRLAEEIGSSTFTLRGKSTFKEEFVTCGGVQLSEINFKNMESKICGGLFFAGEIIDIDGVTGGFNFQNAWTTAFLAGHAN